MALIRGTIYKLSDDEGYFYYGSTIQTLSDRFDSLLIDSTRPECRYRKNIFTPIP